MSENNDPTQKRKLREPEYAVGYGKPPVESRFKPGVSGNPHGRPRGARGLKAVMGEMMSRRITITESGKSKRVPLLEALLLMLSRQALKGDYRTARMLLDAAGRLDYDAPTDPSPFGDINQIKRSIREAAMNLVATARKKTTPTDGGGQS